MGNSNDEPSVPEWQKAKTSTPATSSTPVEGPATIEQAKKFLQDDEVRRYPRQKKLHFLKSKGLSETDVRELIAEETDYVTAPAEAKPSPKGPQSDAQIQVEPSTVTTPPRFAAAPPEFHPDNDTNSPSRAPVAEPATVRTPPRSTPEPPEFQPDTNTQSQSSIAEPAAVPTPPRTNPPPAELGTNTTTTDSNIQADDTNSQSSTSEPPALKTPPRTNPPPSVIPSFGDTSSSSSSSRPPIVTYPEFLTKPVRPPPLMTVNRFLTTLYGFAGLSTLLYGTSKYIVAPMVDNLTAARIDLAETAKDDLEKLVAKLEGVVSEIPVVVTKKTEERYRDDSDHDGSESEYDDPTELFHRDVGVQTSPPLSPTFSPSSPAGSNPPSTSQTETQLKSLSRLTSQVRSLEQEFKGQQEEFEDLHAVLGVFKDELDELRYSTHDFVGGGGGYSYGAASREPDDEIRKMKEGIRRVKGVLLSARSFPVVK